MKKKLPVAPEASSYDNSEEYIAAIIRFLNALNAFLDDAIKAVFVGGSALPVVNKLKAALHDLKKGIISFKVTQGYAIGWNVLDAIGAALEGIQILLDAVEAKHHLFQKRAIGIALIVSSVQLAVGTTLTALAQHHILVGKTAAVAMPSGGIAFAVSMWVAVGKEAVHLANAINKTDEGYLLKNRIIKHKKLQERIEELEKKAQEAALIQPKQKKGTDIKKTAQSLKKWLEIIKKIRSLKEQQEVLKTQALAIAKVYFFAKGADNLNETDTEIMADLKAGNNPILSGALLGTLSPKEKKLTKFLMDKQYDKVLSRIPSLVVWLWAAIGMSLIAVSVFCPVLLLAGIAVTAIASLGKVTEMFSLHKVLRKGWSKITRAFPSSAPKKIHKADKTADKTLAEEMDNFIINKLARRQERRRLYKNYNANDLTKVPTQNKHKKNLETKTRVKLHIAYTLYKDKFTKNQSQHIKESKNTEAQKPKTEEEYYNTILKLPSKKRDRFLLTAVKKYLGNKILLEHALSKGLPKNAISKKHGKRIIAERYRKHYSFFSSSKKHDSPENRVLPDGALSDSNSGEDLPVLEPST